MYFTNALYEPTPDPQVDLASTQAGVKSYGATGSAGAADGDATVTVPPAADGSAPDAGSGCVLCRCRARCRACSSRSARLRRPTLEELVASLDIQDAPFVPPRFEPWRLMERIIANCAAVCIWVGGACRANALQARAGTHTDATVYAGFHSRSMVRSCAAVEQARGAQPRVLCLTRVTCVSGTKSTSTCCRLSALTTPVAGAASAFSGCGAAY